MSAIADTLDVAGRNLRTLFRTPQALIFATIQPVIFVLLFRYAFGGAIRVPGEDYVDYLMPGIFAQSVAFGAVGTAVGLSADIEPLPVDYRGGKPLSAAEDRHVREIGRMRARHRSTNHRRKH